MSLAAIYESACQLHSISFKILEDCKRVGRVTVAGSDVRDDLELALDLGFDDSPERIRAGHNRVHHRDIPHLLKGLYLPVAPSSAHFQWNELFERQADTAPIRSCAVFAAQSFFSNLRAG
ncbi:hypothetical protein [Chelatococcus reniformis]|uniref:hypothetical protein n=1 Tax=Chelatococcus reniformis TaxID=1494448 RepID=UPI00166CEDC1|nr:hypothetical protein [Chelatococcus reniformis]